MCCRVGHFQPESAWEHIHVIVYSVNALLLCQHNYLFANLVEEMKCVNRTMLNVASEAGQQTLTKQLTFLCFKKKKADLQWRAATRVIQLTCPRRYSHMLPAKCFTCSGQVTLRSVYAYRSLFTLPVSVNQPPIEVITQRTGVLLGSLCCQLLSCFVLLVGCLFKQLHVPPALS